MLYLHLTFHIVIFRLKDLKLLETNNSTQNGEKAWIYPGIGIYFLEKNGLVLAGIIRDKTINDNLMYIPNAFIKNHVFVENRFGHYLLTTN